MSKLRAFAPPLAFALFALACALPPYNEDLSLSRMTTGDMHLAASVGPFPYWPGQFEDKEVCFYPSQDALQERLPPLPTTPDFPVRGFAAITGEYSVRTVFVDHDGTDYYVRGERTAPLDSTDPERFVYAALAVKDAGTGLPDYLGAAALDPGGLLWYIAYDQDFAQNTTDLNTADAPIGASFFTLDASYSYDWLHVLYRTAPEEYSERSWKTNPVVAGALESESQFRGGPSLLPGLPDQIDNAFYHYCPTTGRSYLSWHDPERREYRNFWWDAAMVLHVMTQVERRIDRVLSNGWLYCRGENLGYLYDADGRFLNQFSVGGLDLVYEIYLGAVAHAVFTIEAWAPSKKDENPRLWFLVYTVPTEELADL